MSATYPSLKHQVVFITGGASGIGAAMVEAFHGQGARVAFVDRDAAQGEDLAGRLAGSWFAACDVTDAAALQGAVAGMQKALTVLRETGRIDEDPALVVSFAERQRLVGKPALDALEAKYATGAR